MPYNRGFHVFCFFIGGKWYRTPEVLDDDAFDELMSMLDWKMPYNMRVFHFSTNKTPPESMNPVFRERPMLYVDLRALFAYRRGVKLKKPDQAPVKVLRLCGEYIIVDTDDTYGRLLKLSESEGKLLFEEYYPISYKEAKAFCNQHHRHNSAPQGHKFSIGLLSMGMLVGVLIASNPKARAQDDGFTLELNRCCVLPDNRNACSKLYAKGILAGRSMGYRRFITYTMPEESGSSVRAVGFQFDGMTQSRPNGWDQPSRPRKKPVRYPEGSKCRWILHV